MTVLCHELPDSLDGNGELGHLADIGYLTCVHGNPLVLKEPFLVCKDFVVGEDTGRLRTDEAPAVV